MFGTLGNACTRSCTAIRISRSSTARAIRRSWPKKPARLGPCRARAHRPRRVLRRRALRRSRPRARVADDLRRRADARRAAELAERRSPTRPGSILSSSPREPSATHGLPRRSVRRSSRGRRARPARRSRSWPTRPALRYTGMPQRARTITGSCSPAAARGPCRPRSHATARPPPSARCASWSTVSAASACSWSCGTTVIRSTAIATTRSRTSRCASVSRWSQPTTCTTRRPRVARSRTHCPRCVPAARSTRSTVGCRPRRSRTCAVAAEQARRFARWPGAVERTVDDRAACARST